MEETHFIGLATIIILGIGAQWLAWRIRLPSILLLLLAGFVAGPLTGFLHPDELLGDLLFPFISLSVGLILFEGGMSLKLHELRKIGSTVRNLILVGSLVTWGVGAAAAYYIVGLDVRISLLLGAILIVTGPTVIIPLLRQVRPTATVASILKWESILIDPIGATLSLLVFEWILAAEVNEAATAIAIAILKTILAGGAFGFFGAMLIARMLKRFWIPDYLQSPVTLMVAVGALVRRAAITGVLAVLVLAIFDFWFQRAQFSKDMRMSRKEIKDEHKSSDGDPMVKARIRQVQRESASRRMMDDVPDATVVVTNPTHFAVALSYDSQGAGAPRVVAKGVDSLARRIKDVAREAGVLVYEDPPLARGLHRSCEIGAEIPEDLFKAVAGVLAYVYRVQGGTPATAQ